MEVPHRTAASQPKARPGAAHRCDDRMTAEYHPLQVLLLAFSGWVNREQQRTIEVLLLVPVYPPCEGEKGDSMRVGIGRHGPFPSTHELQPRARSRRGRARGWSS